MEFEKLKKKKNSDRPIPEKLGRVRGNKNIFKVGLVFYNEMVFFFNSVSLTRTNSLTYNLYFYKRGGVAQWIGHLISDQGVPGSIPRRCTFRCGLEQVTFTVCLSTG